MTAAEKKNRGTTLERLKAAILARHFVRLQMGLIVLASVAASLFTSKGLLALGVGSMALRYPLAIVTAYLTFLVGVRLWLHFAGFDGGGGRKSNVDGSSDLGDVDVGSFDWPGGGGGGGGSQALEGGGGNFGGGGASGSFRSGFFASSSGGSSGGGGLDLDGDDLVALLLIALVLAVVVGTGGYLIYQAPSILADAAFQMLLAGGLMKRTRQVGEMEWAGSVFRSTWWLLLAMLVAATSFALYAGHTYPGARTMGDVMRLALHG